MLIKRSDRQMYVRSQRTTWFRVGVNRQKQHSEPREWVRLMLPLGEHGGGGTGLQTLPAGPDPAERRSWVSRTSAGVEGIRVPCARAWCSARAVFWESTT